MIGRRQSEAAIRVGSDGAEWLVWRTKTETLAIGRMTASYSVEGALDQWLARAERFGMRAKRIWLVAGAAECAHRRITLPGTDPAVITQALEFAADEELPLPLDQMWWSYSLRPDPKGGFTEVDIVATPRSFLAPWEKVLKRRDLELAGRIPEGPLLWQELAAIRGEEIDILSVWGERRCSIIRGDERGLTSLLGFLRGAGESWESLAPELRRPLQNRVEGKAVFSVFTSERLRRRITSIPDLLPQDSENHLNRELFIGVGEEITTAVSLLALRRLRLERRNPPVELGDQAIARPRVELTEMARGIEVPRPAIAVSVLFILFLALWGYTNKMEGRNAEIHRQTLHNMRSQQPLLQDRIKALANAARYRADWGSVWLELSKKIQEPTLFEEISYKAGGVLRVAGITKEQKNLDDLVDLFEGLPYLDQIRIVKTEPLAEQGNEQEPRLRFELLADFDPDEVEPFLVEKEAVDSGQSTEQPGEGEIKQEDKKVSVLLSPECGAAG